MSKRHNNSFNDHKSECGDHKSRCDGFQCWVPPFVKTVATFFSPITIARIAGSGFVSIPFGATNVEYFLVGGGGAGGGNVNQAGGAGGGGRGLLVHGVIASYQF